MNRRPTVSLIAALARNGVIGRDNTLPWRLPADMRHFVRLTRGKPVVMGRRNHEDIGRPLPDRHNIVLSRDPGFRAPGCTVVRDPQSALAAAGDADEVMVIGGEAVYRLFLGCADRLYLTIVEAEIEGDRHFPAVDPAAWEVVEESTRPADGENPHAMRFVTYRRRR